MEKRVKVNLNRNLDSSEIARFVQVANRYASILYIELDDCHRVNAKSIMGMMNFLSQTVQEVNVRAEGNDAGEALEALSVCLAGKEG